MPAIITLLRTDGTFEEFKPADDDDARGAALTMALNLAAAGDAVVVGPGNFRQTNVTRSGVYVHLLPGVRIYHDDPENGPNYRRRGNKVGIRYELFDFRRATTCWRYAGGGGPGLSQH